CHFAQLLPSPKIVSAMPMPDGSASASSSTSECQSTVADASAPGTRPYITNQSLPAGPIKWAVWIKQPEQAGGSGSVGPLTLLLLGGTATQSPAEKPTPRNL